MLSELTGKIFPWGSLTGIRPAKIVNQMLDVGMDREGVFHRLEDVFFISSKKAELAYEVALTQDKIRKSMNPKALSIYVGIPFCPTRCLYCSFTSNPMARYERLADLYLDTLIHEMEVVSEKVKNGGFIVESVYVGGGTPTALSAPRLDRLVSSLKRTWFSFSDVPVKEFCVEAGRPDSIDADKLAVLKEHGVSRISINPQSMKDSTLKLIGRCHGSRDVEAAFKLARDAGFNNINTDIIAGLPNETPEIFRYTLEKISELNPENLTVHTMSIKRASELNRKADQYQLSGEVDAMIDMAYNHARSMNMKPYYMYRQKNMLGNLENIGYSIPGKESFYNIHIMEEDQTILAFGAGGISKFVTKQRNDFLIQRVFNVKGVEEYIARSEEMIQRKVLHSFLG
jgi:oxygen-independent coproporphyrinogen-3 oxidase